MFKHSIKVRFAITLSHLFILFFSLLFGLVISASLTGIIGRFNTPSHWLLVIIFSSVCFIIAKQSNWFKNQLDHLSKTKFQKKWVRIVLYTCGILLIFTIFFLPLSRWPTSISGDWFPWDAGKYHFPKAVEMFKSGSANDLSIDYGDYPFGYESLIASSLAINNNPSYFGHVHILINCFVFLTIWALASGNSKLPPSLIFFFIVLLLVSDKLFHFLNLWKVFFLEFLNVGKNDLLLAGSVLSAILFFPLPTKNNFSFNSLFLFGAASSLALAIKPNSFLVIAPLLLFLGIRVAWNIFRRGFPKIIQKLGILATMLMFSMLITTGVTWVIRNYVLIGSLFSETALAAADWSIAANLTNPYFYKYIPSNLIVISLFTGFVLVYGFGFNHRVKYPGLILSLLLIAFIFTPISAFFLRTDVPTQINWRFAESLTIYFFIVALMVLEPLMLGGIAFIQKNNIHSIVFKMGVISISIALLFTLKDSFLTKPENVFRTNDQFKEPVGIDGYWSAYNFVQQNIRDSVIWVENGLPYYAYDSEFSNSITRSKNPDYVVVIKTDWFGGGGLDFPPYFPADWQSYYLIVYEDSEGIVYSTR